ncbi:MAG: SDR family oxidoreductase [Betaproteobacteria bacterium]|nr:SDR family oxidoreductase [Betaproteobacteria bacterium]
MRLAGKHAVVTGAARGIGQALALALAAEGARVTCMDINVGVGDTAELIRARGLQAAAITCDNTQLQQVESALAQAVAAFGPVSVLVANAGGAAGERTPFLDLTPDQWQGMIARNLTGSFHCGLAFARHMRTHGGGSIVFTSSIAAEFAAPELSHYAAAKGGIRMLMRGMALELAPHGIRVNAVAPGVVLTPGNRDIITAPAVMAHFRELVPLGRVAEAAELAGAVIYLASDAASYTTGATITVDGGLTLR